MEVAEREEDSLDLGVLLFELLTDKEGEGSEQISLKAGRRLVCQLDGSFEQADRNILRWI